MCGLGMPSVTELVQPVVNHVQPKATEFTLTLVCKKIQ